MHKRSKKIIQKYPTNLFILIILVVTISCGKPARLNEAERATENDLFTHELTTFFSYEKNPLFAGTGTDTWDEAIRERGYILKEEDGYHLWYTGYREGDNGGNLALGYATSRDGIVWSRYKHNPIFSENWVEDMMVIKHDSLYYMFAEGRNDVAHMLTSTDKIHWNDHGSLKILMTNGNPLTPGPYGTPTVFIQAGVWHLFYERNDEGIWLATSTNLEEWKNVQDEPVIEKGPETYDKYGVALNQVIRHGDYYYAYYHGTPTQDWSEWNTNVAVSQDLITWSKYPSNPILEENKSSGIIVHDGLQYRLYTMHSEVHVHFPKGTEPPKP
jgi:predicted GH43/DUF377 family glycosyl hydrolase